MPIKQDFFTIANGRVKMRNAGYKTTADAGWLADFIDVKQDGSVLDVGVGAGGVALCLLDKNPKLRVTGIDVSEEMLASAWTNALLNGREIELILDNIETWKTGRLFDAVVTNPPYFAGSARKDNAHHNANIEKWIAQSVKRLRARGHFYCIIAPDIMDKVIAALVNSKMGEITIQPLATKNKIERVLISARLGVRTPAKINFPSL